MPKVFAIVLNYNGKETILDCLKSLYQSDYPNLEIVLVDNDSKDGSLELAKQTFPKAHIIKNSKNIGFGAGNNVGIRFALEKFADFVFLLNNDATVEKNTISLLVKAAEQNPKIGIINPLILKAKNGPVWFSGGKIQWSKMRAIHDNNIRHKTKSYATQYASGCAMLISKIVFKKIGLFDENFFLYYEDTDLSLRAKNKNFAIAILPTALAYHKEASERANPLKTYWLVISGLIFFKKHATGLIKFWLFIYLLLRKIKNTYSATFKKDVVALQVQKAYRDFRNHSN